ncbi:MAG TPA: hypothetical protein VHD36_01940 [Pirellulales bacterium]|nr:hypothetical protein [Pirellulales bacterium]
MSETNIERVRDDLAAMRQALGFSPACERDVIGHNLAMAALGVFLTAVTAWTRVPEPIERGSPAHLRYSAWVVVPALVVVAVMLLVSYRRRGLAPLLWRENRQSMIVAAALVPCYVAFVAWTAWLGIQASAITVATFFLFGLFMFGTGILDRSRRYWVGWAVATMAAGACAPLFSFRTTGLLIGLWLMAGGMSTVLIVRWMQRREDLKNAGRL